MYVRIVQRPPNNRKEIMYNKELETNKEAWLKHQENLKANATERLKRNAAWNKAHKKAKND